MTTTRVPERQAPPAPELYRVREGRVLSGVCAGLGRTSASQRRQCDSSSSLKDSPERPRFLGLSVSDDPVDVIALIRGGARGYVTKNIDIAELAEAVRRVGDGDAVFSPRLAGYVLDAFAAGGASAGTGTPGHGAGTTSGDNHDEDAGSPLIDDLTPREVEVMRLLARGYTYREMAERLFISVKTVETHVSHVLRKTQQTNRHQLSRWVSDNRLG
ncbi:LuxR C-terminal-related transcriptional regulator [Corynebacterium variabile]|uniref:LuxR C-terminal-related transcriptional regulator n=1 Tax=Corynebacterium variabile TaxID=1727 RepID=UPI0028AF2D20|nr:LuxR C-terminal-related transcriptional regulator [Corynebacterium variabile]